jgi:hypothetical protein
MSIEKYQSIMMYKTMTAILKNWIKSGMISKGEYRKMNTIIAEKYGLNSCSIFLDCEVF